MALIRLLGEALRVIDRDALHAALLRKARLAQEVVVASADPISENSPCSVIKAALVLCTKSRHKALHRLTFFMLRCRIRALRRAGDRKRRITGGACDALH